MASRALAGWVELDLSRALHPADIETVRSTESARSLVIELFATVESDPRDLFTACARLGTLMADGGASPSLAAATIDNFIRAIGGGHDEAIVDAARASLLEAYVTAIRDAERSVGLATWEYPACAVTLDDGRVAIACGFPTDDPEALAGWASRIAGRLAKAGTKRAVLAGSEGAKAELEGALSLVGIAIGGAETAPASWLDFFRRRKPQG